MKFLRAFLILLIFGLSNIGAIAVEIDTSILKEQKMSNTLTYSWVATPSAVSYEIEVQHKATLETHSLITTNTAASFSSLPPGIWKIKVTATMSDGSTSIIITDQSEL